MKCVTCGKELSRDEVGLSKKLINRGTSSCKCLQCLSAYYSIHEQRLLAMIAQYKRQGCTLFGDN